MKRLLFLLPLFIVNLALTQIPEDGLVGYWPFNGNANDESGNGYNLNEEDLFEYIIDRHGDANSAATQGWANIAQDIINTEYPNEYTFNLWCDVNGENYQKAFFTFSNVQNSSFIGVCNVNTFTSRYTNNTNNTYDLDMDIELTSGWRMFTVTIENQTELVKTMKLYIDNIYIEEINVYGSCSPARFTVGAFYVNGTNPVWLMEAMKVDDIRIYNRILTSEEIAILYNESNTSNPDPTPQNAWQTNNEDIFYYNGQGNVGIGTNTPAAKLTVDGPILSTEVLVKTDISEYPDFVFKPEYKLRTIEETEQFIKENGHLPEIPKD